MVASEALATFALMGMLSGPPQAERRMVATAYCSCAVCTGAHSPERGGHGLTASGRRPVAGRTLAADPAYLSFGRCVVIEGLGKRCVEDTGSAIIGERLDIYMGSHEEAKRWGRKQVWVRPVPSRSDSPSYRKTRGGAAASGKPSYKPGRSSY